MAHRHANSPVVLHVVVHRTNNSYGYNPPIDEIFPSSSQQYTSEDGSHIIGRCNTTHETHYHDAVAWRALEHHHAHARVHVFMWHGGRMPVPPSRPHSNATLLFWTLEPPNSFDFDAVEGFDGEVNYRRSATVWSPRANSEEVRHSLQGFESNFEPATRQSVGVWHDNCDSALRTPLIAALLSSGLRVHSYGDCLRNHAPIGIVTDEHHGAYECRKHRLMVAIEHTACEDYVSANLMHALECGAIPIIARVGGVPDYEGLFGSFPHVDASQPDWLQRVRSIMTNDTAYREAIRVKRPKTPPSPDASASDGIHCRFHDINPRQRGSHERYTWSRCLMCNGSRFHDLGLDGTGDFGNGQWVRYVDCPAHLLTWKTTKAAHHE